jgi:Domain of unknown function (DUF4407)
MNVAPWFYFLAGTSEVVIEDCPPAERNYHTAIGGFVLITAILASLSGGYALYTIFHSVIAAVLFGAFWGMTIGAIDRFVVMTIDLTSTAGRLRTLGSASLRLLLAVFVAIVVARPLELRIFEPEIAGHLQQGVQARLGAQLEAVAAELKRRQEEHEIHGRLAAEEAANAALVGEHAACLIEADFLRAETHQECDGTGGTRVVGAGPVCKLKQADQAAAEARCAGLESRRLTSDASVAALREERSQVLAALRTAAEERSAQLSSEAAAEIAAIATGDTGSLLTRLDALYALSARSDGMAWVIRFVTLLFVLVESLPVGLKLMVAGRGTYANRIHLDEEEATKRHGIERKHRERGRFEHRQAVRSIAAAVREQQRARVLDTVAQGEDVVTDTVNLELRRRTEVVSRDAANTREWYPPRDAPPGDVTVELPRPPRTAADR